MYKFDLGIPVKDSVTGFAGHITGRSDYLTGCNQYLVQPGIDKNSNYVDGRWFDENRLMQGEGEKIKIENLNPPGSCEAAPIK